jgi:hypothetical protein
MGTINASSHLKLVVANQRERTSFSLATPLGVHEAVAKMAVCADDLISAEQQLRRCARTETRDVLLEAAELQRTYIATIISQLELLERAIRGNLRHARLTPSPPQSGEQSG